MLTYGVEIEFGCVHDPAIKSPWVEQTHDSTVNTGLSHDLEWRVGGPNGVSRSRILEILRGACEELALCKAAVDESCGLHIHVGGLTHEALQDLVAYWMSHEEDILYATGGYSFRSWPRKEAAYPWRGNDLSESEERHLTLNMGHSMAKHGTVEFRLFFGTVEYDTIEQALDLVDWVVKGRPGEIPQTNLLGFQNTADAVNEELLEDVFDDIRSAIEEIEGSYPNTAEAARDILDDEDYSVSSLTLVLNWLREEMMGGKPFQAPFRVLRRALADDLELSLES